MSYEDFEIKKFQANKYETLVGNWLQDHGATDIEYNNTHEYDIKYKKDGVIQTVEVKYQEGLPNTGNLFYEFFDLRRMKPTGFSTTTADHWVDLYWELDLKMLWTKTHILKDLLKHHWPLNVRTILSAGDEKGAAGILIKKKYITGDEYSLGRPYVV